MSMGLTSRLRPPARPEKHSTIIMGRG